MVTHVDATGAAKLIAEMEDVHLKNTVAMYVRKLKDARGCLEGRHSRFQDALYGSRSSSVKSKARGFIGRFNEKFPSYVLECGIRNLDISTDIANLREIIGRSTKMVTVGTMLELEDSHIDSLIDGIAEVFDEKIAV